LNCADRVWQVPFYRAADYWYPWISLFAPLAENGPVTELPLTQEQSRLRTKLIRSYPSQWRTWLGLGPGIAWHGLFDPVLKMQRLGLERLWMRPVAGPLLYERRCGVSYADFSHHAARFLQERSVEPPSDGHLAIAQTN
jgi:hypothetical protein